MAPRTAESFDVKGETAIQHVDGHGDRDDKHGHIEGNALLVNKDGEIRKIPVPSSDPNDPLNFRPWEKYAVVFCCCWFSIMGLSIASGLGGILNVFFEMYIPQGYTADQVVLLITLPTLCIGLGNYIILPLALVFGRRPVFLVSMVILLAATVAAALQDSYGAHLAARVIQGLATGTSESLLPLMLTEVTFLHERAGVFGLYWMVQNALSSTINLASTYLNHDLGWRWYYWVFVVTVGVGIVVAYLCAFETQFSRPVEALDGQIVATDEFGVTRVIPDDEAQEYMANMKRAGLEPPPPGIGIGIGIGGGSTSTGHAPGRKTYAQRIRPWSTPHPQPGRVMALSWLYMAQSLSSPGILYAVLTSSIALGCAVGMSLTYNAVLVQEHGWRPQDVGLVNVGGVVGALLGMLYCTFLGAPFVVWASHRNRGVHMPEHHLLTMAPPAVVGVGMLLLYGFTADGARGSSWWGPYLGWTVFQYTFTAMLIISTTFASEAAPKHPGPALVVVVGTKNIVSFGVTYGLTPMVERHGYEWAFGVLAGIMGAIFLLGIPVYFFNPKWRAYVSAREAARNVTMTD